MCKHCQCKCKMCQDCNCKMCKYCQCQCNKGDSKMPEAEKMRILSYYQSTLRNVGVFTTLALASLAAAHSAKIHKNKLGLYARYLASIIFISIACFISWMLVKLDKEYQGKGDPIAEWDWTAPVLILTQVAIVIAIVFSFTKRLVKK